MSREIQISGGLLARNTLLNIVGQAIPLLIGLATIPSVIHSLGNERFGILSLVWILIGYFSVFDLGFSRATIKFASELFGKRKYDKLSSIVWTSLFFNILLGLVGSIAIIAATPLFVEHIFNIPAFLHKSARTTFSILAFATPIVLGDITLRGVLEAGQYFNLVTIVKTPINALIFLIPFFGAKLGFELPTIVLALIITRFLSALIYLWLCFRLFPGIKKGTLFDKKMARSLFSYGKWITLSNVIAPTFIYLERFLIASLLSISALTFYSVPYDVVSRILIFPTSMAMTLFPAFSYSGQNSRSKLIELFSRPSKYLLVAMGAISVILFVFAGQILNFWLGIEFSQKSTLLFKVLVLVFFIHSFAYIPYAALQGLGRPDLKAKLDLFNIVIFIGLAFWFIPSFGITGAALAKLIITIIDTLFLFLLAKNISGLSIVELLPPKLQKGFALTGIVALAILGFKKISKPLLIDLIVIATSISIYIYLFLKFSMDEKDWSLLRRLRESMIGNRTLR